MAGGADVGTYSRPLQPTSQFVMCGNCFRADMYHYCTFGCTYCFANNRGGNVGHRMRVADLRLVAKWFRDALVSGDVSNLKKECLNRRVPIHLGGHSDPFQPCERTYRATHAFLRITKDYDYPVNISTKTAGLDDMYWDVLDPRIHTFSISLIGMSDAYIRRWEERTPSGAERIAFARRLKERGFWVSIRIQPVIDMDEVLSLIAATEDFADFYTVEHLKLPLDNAAQCAQLLGRLSGSGARLVAKGREYEFDTQTKRRNIEAIKAATRVRIGCGDNDLHTLSDTLNCCGVDTMPEAFANWLKYNSMYIRMTGDWSQWSPSSNCNDCINGLQGFSTMKQHVDRYYARMYGHPSQLNLFEP